MKIERRVDELGRIVIPIDARNQLGIKEKDLLSINVEKKKIILEKVQEEKSKKE